MKTTIHITGQPMGNNILRRAFDTSNCEVQENFGNYSLIFKTKKEAVEQLTAAYEYLKAHEGEDVELTKFNSLLYDASSAQIYDPTIY